jgi:MYXO-CTERM domain-containing protein
MVLAVALAVTAPAAHAVDFGAIFTSDVNHNTNVNQYNSFADVYLNGGGNGQGAQLHVGKYCYGITDTSSSQLFSTVGSFKQTNLNDIVFFNLLSGVAPEGGPIGSGITIVNNPQPGVFKLHVWQLSTDPNTNLNCPTTLTGLSDLSDKTDNFKVAHTDTTVNPPAAPEPCSLALLGAGALPLLRRRRRPTA